jgi:hypothetical protein
MQSFFMPKCSPSFQRQSTCKSVTKQGLKQSRNLPEMCTGEPKRMREWAPGGGASRHPSHAFVLFASSTKQYHQAVETQYTLSLSVLLTSFEPFVGQDSDVLEIDAAVIVEVAKCVRGIRRRNRRHQPRAIVRVLSDHVAKAIVILHR